MREFIFFICVCAGFIACKGQDFHYNLESPDQQLKLHKKLNEVSGLVSISDSSIAAVQDEKAVIYFLNPASGEIMDSFDFGKDADFEGLTFYENRFYALRSDGSIYSVSETHEKQKFKFKKEGDFEFEGICLDKNNKRLLVACKAHAKKSKRDYIYIYTFSLDKHAFDEKPLFKIKQDRVHRKFKPSAIGVDPDGFIYVLSSFSKTLLVLSDSGDILQNIQLTKSLFPQAEGLTFNNQGDLFISNEKSKKPADVLVFKRKKSSSD